ncbi:MAG: HAD-IA family hydrolase [Dysgonamonadaceae bacterium]|jgi:HAD superfamily hydrolase (TIGR01509 family)|nr:HAD-IA family hydrolase [Dysgonamonadaceae bacterium]
MIKAVLFDMDGVLYDSMPSHVRAWHETMSQAGVSSSPEDFYLFEGRTGQSTINILFNRSFGKDATPEEIEALYAKKAQRFTELEHPGSKPMPGAREVLEKVKAAGIQRIIVTGSGQHSLIDKLDKNYPDFFDKDLMVTAYDVRHGKPHPEPYRMGLLKGNILPEEALVIENAPLGVESGRAAGIYTIAVNTGPLPDRVLWEAGANALYPSMLALAKHIAAYFH